MSAATTAIVAGVGAVAGGIGTAVAGNQAAKAEEGAANNAANAQLNMFNTAQAESAPSRELGSQADSQLEKLMGGGASGAAPDYSGFTNNPGFQFATKLGQTAIGRQAAAGGSLYSTNTLGKLGDYTQGMASQNYNNYVNQLLQSAGIGAGAATAAGGQAVTTGEGVSNDITNGGMAKAQGANAVGSGIVGLANNKNFLNSITSAFGSGNPNPPPMNTGYNTAGLGGYSQAGGALQAGYSPSATIGSDA